MFLSGTGAANMIPGEDAHLDHDKERERKQRAREYRVAARREKRNRKADEKKQRKLNATILRRMTRNPDKYNKNAERNRLRAIELERRKIHQSAIRQAQHLAALHDPSGALFNVGPVVRLEDGTVITKEALKRREQRQMEKAIAEQAKETEALQKISAGQFNPSPDCSPALGQEIDLSMHGKHGEHPDRIFHSEGLDESLAQTNKVSKKHQKRLALYEPRAPPPKPIIPEGILVPDGEEDWLALWDLSEDQLEKRVKREKKRKAAERKALRVKQKSGKAERRAARDEKRRVYREYKLEWKTIKEELTRRRTKLRSLEDEESKKIAVQINTMERKAALDLCRSLGFTIENTPGTDDIKPKALGMKGVDVDFDMIEKSDKQGDIRLKQPTAKQGTSNRVDLARVAENVKVEYVSTNSANAQDEGKEFIEFDVGKGQDYQTLTYNHKVRRKLRRAIDNAEIGKETLVRDKTIEELKKGGQDVPPILLTPPKPLNVKGHRILDNGKVETPKQERVRARMELTEFNSHMKILRRQAKEAAIHAGLQMHAELTGKIKKTTRQEESETSSSKMKPSLLDIISEGISTQDHVNDTNQIPYNSEDSASDEIETDSDSVDCTSISEKSPESAPSFLQPAEELNKARNVDC